MGQGDEDLSKLEGKAIASGVSKFIGHDMKEEFASDCLFPMLAGALEKMTVNEKCMAAAIDASRLATNLADYLVHKGVPFREVHGMAGKAVRAAAEKGGGLNELSLNEWQAIGLSEADLKEVFDPMKSVETRNAIGGTSPQSVKEQINIF